MCFPILWQGIRSDLVGVLLVQCQHAQHGQRSQHMSARGYASCVRIQAKQEREAVRSVHGEQQAVRQRELRMRHELSQERRRSTLLGIVARATDESDKVKEVQFIRRMEAASLRAALDARLERSGERRRVVLANRQLRHGRDVDDALEDAQRRKRCGLRVLQVGAGSAGRQRVTARAMARAVADAGGVQTRDGHMLGTCWAHLGSVRPVFQYQPVTRHSRSMCWWPGNGVGTTRAGAAAARLWGSASD